MPRPLAYLLSAVFGIASCLVPVCEMSCHPTQERNPVAAAIPAAEEAPCHETGAPANHETPRPANQHPCKPAHDRSALGTLWEARATAPAPAVAVQSTGLDAARAADEPVAVRLPHSDENQESPLGSVHRVPLRI